MPPAREFLDHFNRQVLACQDEAFTLACYLVGDEKTVCVVLQDVIRNVYAGWRGGKLTMLAVSYCAVWF